MKKIFLALILTGAATYTATAQSNNKYAKNYTVCRGEDGSYNVCSNDKLEPLESNYRMSSYEARKAPERPLAVPCISLTPPVSPEEVGYILQRGKVTKVYYETINGVRIERPDPSYGNGGVQYNGEERNNARNLNYGSGKDLPPSTGEIR